MDDHDDDDAATKAAKDAKDAKGDQKAPRRRNKKKKGPVKAQRMMDSASFGKGSGDEDSDDDAPVGLDADSSVGATPMDIAVKEPTLETPPARTTTADLARGKVR